MDFALLRLSLIERAQYELFHERPERPSREVWLRHVFRQRMTFAHRRETFHYVPASDVDMPSPYIVGRIGRLVNMQEHVPPEQGLEETERPAWQAATVIIDPTMHDDGQKVAFEEDSRVGRPTAIMDSLAAYLNRNDGPYFFEPNPISDAETFWDFIRKNEGEVTSVTFEFIAPNMFGQADDYDKEMAAMRDEERVRRAKLQLENPDGLALETPRVKHAVNYAARGTGSIKAKTKRHKKFNSKNRVKKSTIPQNKNGTPLVEVIKNAIFTIFRQ